MEQSFYCGWCHGTTEHNPWCQEPKIEANEKGDPQYWTIRLNRYQRDNLVWLFGAIGYPNLGAQSEGPVEPFHMANTGDWVGEICNMLTSVAASVNPNYSVQQLRDQVQHWLLSAKVHLT